MAEVFHDFHMGCASVQVPQLTIENEKYKDYYCHYGFVLPASEIIPDAKTIEFINWFLLKNLKEKESFVSDT